MHDDAGAEVFAPDAEEVGEAAIDEGGGAIRGAVGEDEEAGDDEVGEPVGLSKGLFPVVPFPIEDETHEEATPEDFLDEGDDDGGADEAERERRPVADGIVKDAGVEAVFPLDDAEKFKDTAGFSGEAPVIVEGGGQQPHADAHSTEDDADEAPFPRPVELIEFPKVNKRRAGGDRLERIDELGRIIPPPRRIRVLPLQRGVAEEQQHHHEGHEDDERDDVGLGELGGVGWLL